jgi:hypothetical protein
MYWKVFSGFRYKANVTAQITLYFVQEQGESAEFTSVNEHFPNSDWAK